jgi:hypothetical protein
MEPIVGSRGQVFSVAGSPSAGFGVHSAVAKRVNSSPELLGVSEMGVYCSSFRPFWGYHNLFSVVTTL